MSMFNLQEMERRLAEIDAERNSLMPLIEAARAYEKLRGKIIVEKGGVTIRQRSRQTGTRPAPVMEATEQVVIDFANEHGIPVTTARVVEIMRDKGLPVPDRNPNNVISARLSNSNRIRGRRGHGWWPADRPWPGDEAEFPLDNPEQENPGAVCPRADLTPAEGRQPDPRSVVDRDSGPER